jgi:prepilin-type N-terminal cleavage/methylation domain-containing protein
MRTELPHPYRRRGCVTGRDPRAFTLVEILAALLMMGIIIPVAMEGMSVASRVGVLGQRKAAAMRIAEQVLNTVIIEGNTTRASDSGTIDEGVFSYPWTLRSEPWTSEAMSQLTVTVSFTVQGNVYDVSATTLLAPAATEVLP